MSESAHAKAPTRPIVGIVLVDKPAGFTSNRVLQRVKRLYRAEKAGHTGTLDPMATGMLPICFGAATKVSGLMLESSKRYLVTARFGSATDTGDATGNEIDRAEPRPLPVEQIEIALAEMRGKHQQLPPMYSAVKHQGRRLYELARQGKVVDRAPRAIEIFDLSLEEFLWPDLVLEVHCSKGTYVRTLVTDLAGRLGTLGHVTALRRLSVAPFQESEMVSIETLESDAANSLEKLDRWLLGPDAALIAHPALGVSQQDSDALRCGRRVRITGESIEGEVRIYDPSGGFVGIGKIDSLGELKPARIFPC